MERSTMVGLSPQATIIRQKDQLGVFCSDRTIWSRDGLQAVLLLAIDQGAKSVGELKTLLMHTPDGPAREEDAALIFAEFVLTFEDALKN